MLDAPGLATLRFARADGGDTALRRGGRASSAKVVGERSENAGPAVACVTVENAECLWSFSLALAPQRHCTVSFRLLQRAKPPSRVHFVPSPASMYRFRGRPTLAPTAVLATAMAKVLFATLAWSFLAENPRSNLA